ncbi:MAG: alpha-glucan family phosphorylase, partial [Saprospiraceae bacterium]|nr:alpha-glucan family phosphorylase [Saprospiraceae bacterium]
LYGGGNEHRLKQEILLGIGGVRALKALGYEADLYHLNEGHAAFCGLERLRNYIQQDQLSFDEALEVVRSSSLFTTHTPVPAGHDYFSEELLRKYLQNYSQELNINWELLTALGKVDPANTNELFSMSHLAIRLSQEVNGVSKLHGEVSRKMFNVLYPGYNHSELHIGHVTNSVHYPTWIANEWHQIYLAKFGTEFVKDQSRAEYWKKIREVPDETIAETRRVLKQRLLEYIKDKLKADLTRRGVKPAVTFNILKNIRKDALVVGFARRFATYKRAHLLFTNLDRLAELVNREDRPVMFVFAGKAHPADQGGQGLIKRIVEISHRPEFAGKIIFLEGYHMEMAKLLVQGVDIWLNTPTRPKEASGTSGMKAALNGVLNFSVLDGWWAEGYQENAGWAISLERTYEDQHLQDELDAETLYNVFETDIIPTYFEEEEKGISKKWIGYIRNIIADVAPYFTMKRMLDDYYRKYYEKLYDRAQLTTQKDFRAASEIAQWKTKVLKHWDEIQVENTELLDTENFPLPLGQPFSASIQLYLDGIKAEWIGLEVIFFKRIGEEELEPVFSEELQLARTEGKMATFECEVDPNISGVYEFGFRLFPKHELLPNRQDFNLVRWL